jgi:ribosomal-protein-serine acetyltransferase
LVIRCYQPADAELLHEAIMSSLDHLRPWMPWAKFEPTDLASKVSLVKKFQDDFRSGRDFVFGIFNEEETRLLGSTGLHTRLEEGGKLVTGYTKIISVMVMRRKQ